MNCHSMMMSFRRLIDGDIVFQTDKSAGNKKVMHNIKRKKRWNLLQEKKGIRRFLSKIKMQFLKYNPANFFCDFLILRIGQPNIEYKNAEI